MMWILGLLMLGGCPTDAPVDENVPPGAPGAPGEPGAPGGPPPGEGTPPPQPEGAGAPGGENTPPPMSGPPTFKVEAGAGVKVSGTISYGGASTGSVRLDFFSEKGELLHALALDKVGAWSVDAPKDAGKLKVSAFIDTDGNGPSPYEPSGESAVTVAAAPVSGVELKLVDGKGTPPAGLPTIDPNKPDAMKGARGTSPAESAAAAGGGRAVGNNAPAGGAPPPPPSGAPPADAKPKPRPE
jgi:hypothetical protein